MRGRCIPTQHDRPIPNAMPCKKVLLVVSFLSAFFCNAAPAPSELIDYSHAGYGGGGVAIPSVLATIAVTPSGSDDTAAIQAAIDRTSLLAADARGMRGAVVLRPGKYRVGGQLHLNASGIVLRGEDATLSATGQSRRTLIFVRGEIPNYNSAPRIPIATDAPAGATRLTLTSVDGLAVGARVAVRRPSTAAWIRDLGMDQFSGNFSDIRLNWTPCSRDLAWTRTIVAIDAVAHSVSFDAPITTALESRYGDATVQVLPAAELLRNVGIENFTLESEFDSSNPSDEEHAWNAIQLEQVENAWVSNVTASHFASAAVWVGAGTKNVTIQDCISEAPVGENAGWRRFGFYAGGEEILVQRCTADQARQPFLAGLCSAGPNVFLDCTATHATGDSGSIESWATGVLFDRVKIDGGRIVLGNLGSHWQGAGWSAANSMLWNCSADLLVTENPPGAVNRNVSDPSIPSLYRAQLAGRLDGKTETRDQMPETGSRKQANLVSQTSDVLPLASGLRDLAANPLAIVNSHVTMAGKTLFGGSSSNAWWKGQTVPARAADLGWSVTRWAPGRTGPGLTEDLALLAQQLSASGNVLVQVWPGLWYDRRRDAHVTEAQADSETWAPFYEQPWARSGQGKATDGLSKYDLTKFNPWYWNRLHDFAAECARRGMILYHHFYNHHNLVEVPPHWADFPWRPVNCLQETGFPEPPPYAAPGGSGKRVFMVDLFYDVSNPVRRELHRLYIWHGLDVLADQPNVIHTLAFQFAGPLSFQQFFLDTVAEWEAARGKHARIALNTSKAVTDAILADPVRAPRIEVIDQRYWQYLADGSLFAPDSGGKLAFREQRVAAFGKDAVPPSTAALVYKQVRDYRDRFPEKAIIAGHAGQGPIPILMAGGALPLLADYSSSQPLKIDRDDRALIAFVREHLATALVQMHPVDVAPGVWCLSDDHGDNQLYYSSAGEQLAFAQPADFRNSTGLWFDPKTGASQPAQLKDGLAIAKPTAAAWLLLVQRKH
jgi:hypothetical protein